MFVPLTPLRCLHRAVDLYGSRIGVVSGDRQFTYAELGQRAERLATGLQKLGIAAGDRVAYLSYNNHQLLEGYFGVIQAHAILMPLNVRLSEPELAAISSSLGRDHGDLRGRLRAIPSEFCAGAARTSNIGLPMKKSSTRAAPSAPMFSRTTRWPSPNSFIPAAAPARPKE